MSECKLILYKDPNFAGESEEFTGDRGVTHNDHASSYKTTGDCSNTSWAVFKDNNGDNKGTGVIIGKGDASGGNFDSAHETNTEMFCHNKDCSNLSIPDKGRFLIDYIEYKSID